MRLTPGTRLGPYEIVSLLGEGGMGEVYRGRDHRLDREVAVKILPARVASSERLRARFRIEARALAALSHPNILQIFDIGEEGDVLFAVTELLDGRSLDTRLASGPAGWRAAVGIGLAAAEGLAAAHGKGIVHRDLKPSNIHLLSDGRVKILDFGLARMEARRDPDPEDPAGEEGARAAPGEGVAADRAPTIEMPAAGDRLTRDGTIVGTIAYMSPEQLAGREADARSDIFSLGCVLYETIAGRRPYRGATANEILASILMDTPPPLQGEDGSGAGEEAGAETDEAAPAGWRRDVASVIRRCLSSDPAARFATAAGLVEALRPLLREAPGPGAARVGERISPGAFPPGPGAGATAATGSAAVLSSGGSVPRQLTTFIGRERELAELEEMIGGTSLLTLVGFGGCGKTRLAIELAARQSGRYESGARFVDLSALTDSSLVPQRVAAALGVREQAGRAVEETLADAIGGRSLLLVVDNCEHLLDACASLIEGLLRRCPQLTVVATGREPLGVPGETQRGVGALEPPAPDCDGLEAIAGNEAVRLFTDRARAVEPGFALDDANAQTVAGICRKLEGIPLAIELAAARVKALAPGQILDRLADRFHLLSGGARTGPRHHQTLRATLDWSHDLLAEPERALFRRLSVFSGGWGLEAAEAVCAGGEVAARDLVDLLSRLVQRSLVTTRGDAKGGYRYGFLETVREYARERLEDSGEESAVRNRHLEWVAGFTEALAPLVMSRDMTSTTDRLAGERDNIRAALEWSCSDGGDRVKGLAIAGVNGRYWRGRGVLGEGREWLSRLLGLAPSAPDAIRARALEALGGVAWLQGDYDDARAALTEARDLYRRTGDRLGVALTVGGIGLVCRSVGEFDEAERALAECLEIYREGKYEAGIAGTINNMGTLAFSRGDFRKAAGYYEEALAISRRIGETWGVASRLGNLAEAFTHLGRSDEAVALHGESLRTFRALRDRRSLAEGMEMLAQTLGARGETVRAATLLGAAEELRRNIGYPRFPVEREQYRQELDAIRAALGDEGFDTAYGRGQAMTLDEVLDEAIGLN